MRNVKNCPRILKLSFKYPSTCRYIQMGSTEKFLAVAKQLAALVTPAERRLYFRTASAHMASGCPILALDVLMRLPRNISMVVPGSFTLSSLVNGGQVSCLSLFVRHILISGL